MSNSQDESEQPGQDPQQASDPQLPRQDLQQASGSQQPRPQLPTRSSSSSQQPRQPSFYQGQQSPMSPGPGQPGPQLPRRSSSSSQQPRQPSFYQGQQSPMSPGQRSTNKRWPSFPSQSSKIAAGPRSPSGLSGQASGGDKPNLQMQRSPNLEARGDLQDAVNAGSIKRKGNERLGLFDYLLMGFVCILLVILIGILMTFALRFIKGLEFSIERLWPLFILFLIYAGCVGAGYLWGRYQSNTKAMQENVELKVKLEELENEIATMKTPSRSSLSKVSTPNISFPTEAQVRQKSNIQFDAEPNQIIVPLASIYDSSRDPDDFSGKEKEEHPHEKLYPAPGEKGDLRYDWQIIAASRRGYGHAYEGKYREDDFNIRISSSNNLLNQGQDVALIAIADGVSSKKLSRYGALAAVQGATRIPETQLQELARRVARNPEDQEGEKIAHSILIHSLEAAHESVKRRADQVGVGIDELHSTLLVFLCVPCDKRHLFVASVQIGDGVLFVLQPNRGPRLQDKWHWLQQPQIQASGNEVQPFMRTDPDVWSEYVRCKLLEDATFIMGMTDGIADDIEPPRATPERRDPDPFLMVDDFYQRIVLPAFQANQPGEALMKQLAYKKRQSHDDRTLVCLLRR